ncbi:MAG: MarR family winged helix-turn-helix transcriptional regulator [Acidimicrobiia bacterium]
MAKRASSPAREAWGYLAALWFSDELHDSFHAACAAADVSPPVLKALLSMEPGEAKPMRALATSWRCDASWVTGIVDGLEEKGYARRLPFPSDRRVKVVEMTAAGQTAKQRALDRLQEPPSSLLALPVEDQEALRDLLRKMHDHVPDQGPDAPVAPPPRGHRSVSR